MLGPAMSSYRQRRSFRKYYYGIFVVFVIVLWQTGTLQSKWEPMGAGQSPSPIPDAEQKIIEDTHRVLDGQRHHVHHRPTENENLEGTLPTPTPGPDSPAPVLLNDAELEDAVPEDTALEDPFVEEAAPKDLESDDPAPKDSAPKDSVPRKNAGGKGRLTTEDESNQHDVDSIDSIHDSTNEDVEHAAKLTHPDDDDASMSDSERPESGGDRKTRKGNKDNQEVLGDEETDISGLADVFDEDAPRPIEALKKMTPWTESYIFPSFDECESIKERANMLPDLLHVPFEQSVKDVTLHGWEDEWIANAQYTGPKLDEPKIDFVYNCTSYACRVL